MGSNTLAAFVNADPTQLKFDKIQADIQQIVQDELRTNGYGIQIEFLGIRQLGLPDSVTTSVFDRMKSERGILISQLQNAGQAEAKRIETAADLQANETLAYAQAEAKRIKGAGEAEATVALATFRKNPELEGFLLRLDALQQAANPKMTWLFDQHTPPFDLFQGFLTNAPVQQP